MSITGQKKSYTEKFIRAIFAFLGGTILTGVLSFVFGANLVTGFIGGSIAGYFLGAYFTRQDYERLKKMYCELDIDHFEGSETNKEPMSIQYYKKILFRAIMTFLAGSCSAAVLSLFFGTNLITGFIGSNIAGYYLGVYFTKQDYEFLKKMFNDLDIDHIDVTSSSDKSVLPLNLKSLNIVSTIIITSYILFLVFILFVVFNLDSFR